MAVNDIKFKLQFTNREEVESITSKIQSLVADCHDKQRATLIAGQIEEDLLAMVVTSDSGTGDSEIDNIKATGCPKLKRFPESFVGKNGFIGYIKPKTHVYNLITLANYLVLEESGYNNDHKWILRKCRTELGLHKLFDIYSKWLIEAEAKNKWSSSYETKTH